MTAFSTQATAIRQYLSDESSAFTGHADRVYFPANAGEIAEVLREATELRVGVSVSGAGTSITGARVPTTGGWILATDRVVNPAPPDETTTGAWERVPAGDGSFYLDAGAARARVPCGIRLSDLDAALSTRGLLYPPMVTEASAMLGGTIATNASGARSYHYGDTRAWIEALKVVTAGGEIVDLRRGRIHAREGSLTLRDGLQVQLPRLPRPANVKNVAGYFVHDQMDAVDLFIGGEGTLGVVVEAEVRLAVRPADAVSLIVYVHDREDALDFADGVRDGSLDPWATLAVEYFDRNALDFMRESYGHIPSAAAAVLVELSPPAGAAGWQSDPRIPQGWMDIAGRHSPGDVWAVLPSEYDSVRMFRHALPDHVNDYVRTRAGKLGTDFAVPPRGFRKMMGAYDAAGTAGVRTVLFGHLGEYHLHLNFLADNPDQMATARRLYLDLAMRAIDLGGTVSAEHGVGKKTIEVGDGRTVPLVELMFGHQGMAAARLLKEQLDPARVLNRNTVLPWGGDA